MTRTARNTILLLVFIGLGMVVGAWRELQQPHGAATLLTATAFDPQPVPEFSLMRTNGEALTIEALEQHWSFLYFGYTHCPDICPAALGILGDVANKLPEDSAQFIFVSADPGRDTPERLETYLSAFSDRFIGALGEHEEVTALARSLHIYLSNAQTPEATDIDHGNTLLLINPKAQLSAIFTSPDNAEAILADFMRLSAS